MSLGTRNITQRITVNTDAAVTLDGDGYSIPWPVNLTVLPGSGGTILVEWQNAHGGSWTAWPHGTVSAKTVGILNGPVYALRFTAAVANGIVEVAQ